MRPHKHITHLIDIPLPHLHVKIQVPMMTTDKIVNPKGS